MTLSLVLHDSEVASVTAVDPDIRVRFAAAAMRKPGAADGERDASGFSRGVVLRLRGAQVICEQEPLIGRIRGGRLQAGGRWLDEIPLPLDLKGPVHLELAFANRAYLVAAGTGIDLRFEAEPNFADSLAC